MEMWMSQDDKKQEKLLDKKQGLKGTLNLPRTEFAMKANLPQNEPARLAAWHESGLYEQIREVRTGAPKYILHDGPPYANGAIHLGQHPRDVLRLLRKRLRLQGAETGVLVFTRPHGARGG
jgi:isoleucyl-tRNA synthetase